MLPQQTTVQHPLRALTPFPTHPSGLFVVTEKRNPFAINQIQLFPQNTRGGVCGVQRRHAISLLSLRRLRALWGSALHCHRFACPMFSKTYKTLFQQPLYLHIYTKPQGVAEGASQTSRRSTAVWMAVSSLLLTSHHSPVTNHESRNFVPPLFSWSYKLLFPQALSFHNHLRCPPGVTPQRPASPKEPRDEAPGQPMIGFWTPWPASHRA
jgi:hypothetical protein